MLYVKYAKVKSNTKKAYGIIKNIKFDEFASVSLRMIKGKFLHYIIKLNNPVKSVLVKSNGGSCFR